MISPCMDYFFSHCPCFPEPVGTLLSVRRSTECSVSHFQLNIVNVFPDIGLTDFQLLPATVKQIWSPILSLQTCMSRRPDNVGIWCFVLVCVMSFAAQSTTRSCRAGQLIVALFLGRLRPKRLTSTKRGCSRQQLSDWKLPLGFNSHDKLKIILVISS